jgi:acyl-coenzyme A thioesterase PaaI-like protein
VVGTKHRIRSPLASPPAPDAPDADDTRPAAAAWVELVHNLHDGSDVPEQVAASRRAADAARRVVAGLTGTPVDAPTLDEVTATLEHVAAVLEPHQLRSRFDNTGGLHGGTRADYRVWESHPLLGPSHPFAPPIRVERHGDRAVATATYNHVYEGPPGAVHGGVVAAAFDIVLGSAASIVKRPGLTGTLTVRYRKAMPLYTPIRFEGWIEKVEERKTLVAARATAGDELVAEAEGVFVRISERRLDPPDLRE